MREVPLRPSGRKSIQYYTGGKMKEVQLALQRRHDESSGRHQQVVRQDQRMTLIQGGELHSDEEADYGYDRYGQ